MTDNEKADHEAKGIRVLGRRHIESYLYDDEVLEKLCVTTGHPNEIAAVLQAKKDALAAAAERHPADHMKAASGRLFSAIQKALGIGGKSSNAFMRDVLAPLVVPGTKIYDELKKDVFGENPDSIQVVNE